MTVIAWDGKTLAADRMASSNYIRTPAKKLLKYQNHLLAGCGNLAELGMMFQWFCNKVDGEHEPTWPAFQTRENFTGLVVVTKIRKKITVCYYEHVPNPVIESDKFWAWGSGREIAIGALHMGATAEEAVKASNVYCTDCGMGVESISFD